MRHLTDFTVVGNQGEMLCVYLYRIHVGADDVMMTFTKKTRSRPPFWWQGFNRIQPHHLQMQMWLKLKIQCNISIGET